ncbi:MAG: rRNA 2'-O-methyl-C2498 methyltransferase RlmM [bacterium]|nr:rRNA 2'-O-methyl-C2498 methyltransferase RlmM [bacterium]
MARREQRGGRRGAARHGKGASTIGRSPSLRKPEPRAQKPKSHPLPTVRAHTKLPEVVAGPIGLPRASDWLFTTRPGAEQDLIEELVYADARAQPHPVAPSLVAARARKGEQAFARQAFRVHTVVENALLSRALGETLAASGAPQPWAFDLWVPDSDEGNPLAPRAASLAAKLSVPPAWAQKRTADARAALADNGLYAQACLLPPGDRVAVGTVPARDAPSLAPGGRLRVHVPEIAPSRAAMKLEEAFLWLDRAPDAGDVCVDLGAAPGGWSWVLLERRARVIAVDPAFLARSLQGKRGVEHIRGDAFKFEPREPVDWLFSDMAWRPLESAALLAKWARRRWARLLIANIKLPMKKKAEMLVRVREILTDGGWTNLRMRQLYHDREEVTIAGVRL